MESTMKKIYLFLIFFYFSTFQLLNTILGGKQRIIVFSYAFFIFIYIFIAIARKYEYKSILYVLILLMLLYYLLVIVNGIMFGDNEKTFMGIYEYIIYSLPLFIPIFCLYRDINRKTLEKIFASFLIINFVTSILSFYEYSTGKYIVQSDQITYISIELNNMVRAKVFNDSYLGLGALIAQLSIFNLYFLLSDRFGKRIKVVCSISFFIDILGIIATNSRGPFMAGLLSIVLFFIVYYIYIIGYKKSMYKKFFFIFITVIMILFIIEILNFILNYNGQITNSTLSYLLSRFKSIFNWNSDASNVLRKHFWNYFFYLFKQNFWTGIGVSSTGSHINTISIGPTESGVLKRFVELGIFGGMIYYLFIVITIVCLFSYLNKIKKDYEKKLILITMFAALAVVFIDDITYQVCENFQTMFFFWFIYGLSIVTQFRKEDNNCNLHEGGK